MDSSQYMLVNGPVQTVSVLRVSVELHTEGQ